MTYSNKIKIFLETYGRSLEGKDFIDCRKELPIRLSHVSDTKIKPVSYKPEIYYVRKKDRKFITFQVFDSQERNQKAEIGDVFCAFFTGEITNAYFFVRTSINRDKINDLISIIESKLVRDFKATRSMFPKCSAILVTSRNIKNEKNFYKLISSLRKKDKW